MGCSESKTGNYNANDPYATQRFYSETDVGNSVFCTPIQPKTVSIRMDVQGIIKFSSTKKKMYDVASSLDSCMYYRPYTDIESLPDCLKSPICTIFDIKEKDFLQVASDIRVWCYDKPELLHFADYLTYWSGKCTKLTKMYSCGRIDN